jgi:modulator of FtsH protease
MVEKNKNSTAGLFWVFALTGWMGFTLGPIISYYLATSGSETIMTALGGTALIFFACSGYVLITRKELSFMSGFLMTGIIVAFVAAIANIFLQIQGLSLAISCIFLLLSSGIIMWQTSAIIHGGERNYISATVTLYVMLYNIFTSLLHLLGLSSD